jgi:CubicO group peptidase (beta-lactamase class C family)
MIRLFLALVAASLAAGPIHAQVALSPGTPSILFWTPQQQSEWYRHIETVYRVETVARGERVHPLSSAGRTIDPTFSFAGRTYTVADYMDAYKVSGLLVLRHGKVVLERYGMGRKPTDRWTSFSVAKSITSTLVGAAIQDGRIKSLSSQVTDYIPELKGSAYEGVTVRQLLMMSCGVRWNEDYADPNSDVARAGVVGAGLASSVPGMNPIVAYMRTLPRANAPGAYFNYNTGETDLVGILVSKATGKGLAAYASEKIWKPYGMERDALWVVDGAGQERGGCCISMTLRDYGRFGQFMLDGGMARDRPVLPPDWAVEATSKQIDNGQQGLGYGYFWWMGPGGAYQATGIFGQSITTFRQDRVVIVINSAWPRATGRDLSAARAALIEALHKAAVEP